MDGMTRRDVRAFVGARVREFRRRSGMGIRTLSEISDIPELMVGAIERGRMRVTFENLLCLARALGVGVTAFFEDDEGGGGTVKAAADGRG
ncbi:MAG: helix-turn-helix domain-containing protein [Planctomycetota bacterium]|jgi:transcriptional regulator with XRE-family HTH domain